MTTQALHRTRRSRSGNALVIALGFSVLVVGLITAASTTSVDVLKSNGRRTQSLKARAAVEAVLQRHESAVITKAQSGALLTWTGDAGQEANFGQEFFGDCVVRWKIEPCRTVRAQDVGLAAGAIAYLTNPSPSTTTLPNTADGEQPNDYIYLYRVAAEARLDGADPNAPIAVAQGVRYVSINEQPLFRYVIFYAQRGAKGDIEFSHTPALTINGNVHSNGAIYIGASPMVNNWGAAYTGAANTTFGPNASGGPVLVEGLDGIFKLHKPLMYGAYDNLLNSGAGGVAAIGGTNRGGTAMASSYDLSTVSFFNEASLVPPALPDLTSIATATRDGKVINPYRIKNDTGFITGGSLGSDTQRQINSLALAGDWGGINGNDSRDQSRAVKFTVSSIQPPASGGWGGYVRTGLTNCQNIKIPKEITGGIVVDDASLRPLEAQTINYKNPDADNTTDNHEAFAPVFATGATTTTETIPSSGLIIEKPGLFLNYALVGGTGDVAMTRNATGTGWSVTTTSGGAMTDPQTMGLVIRERPIPDTTIWPGTAIGVRPLTSASADYMPYAYGKHWRPSPWPFTAVDVSDGVHPTNSSALGWGNIGLEPSGSTPTAAFVNGSSTVRQKSYTGAGTMRLIAAANEGRADTTDNWNVQGGVSHKARFYNDVWRFVHLKKPTASTTAGLSVKYFKDSSPFNETQTLSYLDASASPNPPPPNVGRSLTGVPNYTGTTTQITTFGTLAAVTTLTPAFAATGTPAPTNTNNRFSVRWEGFVIPAYSETYTFALDAAGDGCRIWVDGELLTDPNTSWMTKSAATFSPASFAASVGATAISGTTSGPLVAGRAYPIVIDFYKSASTTTMPSLKWISTSQALGVIPSTALRQPLAGSTGFDPGSITAVQAKIDLTTLSGPAGEKVGLMIRDGRAGLSPLLSGRDAYAGIFYNPTRGFFVQRRLAASAPVPTDVGTKRWYVGGGSANQTAPSAATITSVTTATTAPAPVTEVGELLTVLPATGTATYLGTTTTYSPVTRTGLVTSPAHTPFQYTGYPRQVDTSSTSTTNQSASTGTYYLGDGTARTGIVYGGSGVASKTTTGQRYMQDRKDMIIYADLVAGSAGNFLSTDTGKAFTIYANASTSTTTTTLVNASTGWSYVSGTRMQTTTTATTNGPVVNGTSATTNYTLAANYVYSGNAAEMNAVGAFGRTDWVTAPGSYSRSGTTISAPTPTGWTYPTGPFVAAAIPVPADPIPDALDHSFAIARANTATSVIHDVNSYVSAWGNWFAAPVAQTNPWMGIWISGYLVPSATTNTSSFRPDLWYGKAGATTAVPPVPASGSNSTPITPSLISTRWLDDKPTTLGTVGPNVFLRIERGGTSPNYTLTYKYYSGPLANPAPTDFVAITNADNVDVTDTITGWSNLLIGPAVQSGSKTTATTVTFMDIKVQLTAAAADSADISGASAVPDGVIDSRDWDTIGLTGTALPMARYMASQYQVFWGNREITEDFFNYTDPTNGQPLASEDWIYNSREFWSQSNRWEDGTLKDTGTNPDGSAKLTNRLLFAKTTLLTLDFANLQTYLKNRLLSVATKTPITNPGFVSTVPTDYLLSSRFSGLIYAARTNRYPWNPDFTSGARNPYSPAQGIDYPNLGAAWPNVAGNSTRLGTQTTTISTMASAGTTNGYHNLQPYDITTLAVAPAFRPQDFHHGVRIKNAANVDWGYTTPATSTTPAMTQSRTSFVTPNQLYIQGDFNTGTNTLYFQGAFEPNKTTPVAVMGDAVTLLSRSFDDITYQNADIRVFPSPSTTISGTSPLAVDSGDLADFDTTYNTCVVTNNQPTTREGVREGQGAPVIDTLMYLENWGGRTMNYKGSLVVMDSRRYTRAFLLDVPKTHGRSMMGTLGWNALPAAPDWPGQTRMAYAAPSRVMLFNDDLLTEEGTPPFAPFGVTASGIGGWVKTVR